MDGFCAHAHKYSNIALDVHRFPGVANTQGEGPSKVHTSVMEGRSWGGSDSR